MRRVLPLLVLLTLAFAPAPPPRRERAQGRPERIEGHWRQVSGPNVGVLLVVEPGRMTFSGWKGVDPTSRVVYDLTVDPRKRPATYDVAYQGRKEPAFLGIYKLEGDTLTCCNRLAGHGRPAAFEGAVEVYRRVKR
jgi:uncharacterized protein (TIGR03067 family)